MSNPPPRPPRSLVAPATSSPASAPPPATTAARQSSIPRRRPPGRRAARRGPWRTRRARSRSNSTQSRCLAATASIRGVWPQRSRQSTGAPASSRSRQVCVALGGGDVERPPLVVVRGVRVRPGPQQSLQDGHVGVEREATERPGEVRHDERPAALLKKSTAASASCALTAASYNGVPPKYRRRRGRGRTRPGAAGFPSARGPPLNARAALVVVG